MKSIFSTRRGSTLLILGLLAILVQGCGYSAKTGVESDYTEELLDAEAIQLNLESFDMVWSRIQDKHWDPELGGLDWPAVKEELRPQMEIATTMSEARSVVRTMINRLGQSHFGIFPASVYEDAAAATEGDDDEDGEDSAMDNGVTGLDVRVRDSRILVMGVQPGSPAAEAGVVPGWEVLAVGEVDLLERVAKMEEALPEKSSKGLTMSLSVMARLDGKVGDVLTVSFLNARGKEVDLELTLTQARGKMAGMGNLPAVPVWHETKTLDGGVGYFSFNYFLGIMDVMPAFNQAMKDFSDAPGMIIDLRGNPGGLGAMAMGMAGWFMDGKGHQLGVMKTRAGELNFAINPRAGSFSGPVALLIDEITASTSEIMAGGMKDLGRAKLFGITSAGAALPSVIEKLPNGDGFQYAVGNYISQGGEELEANGVTPDFEVLSTKESLLEQGDPVLAAAMDWIQSQ